MLLRAKNILKLLFIAAVFTIVAGGCHRVTPDSTGLDHQWQILEINTGDEVINPDRRFICMFRHVVQLTSNEGVVYTGNLNKDKSMVFMDFPGDGQFLSRLPEWGIFINPAEMTIQQHTRNTLILHQGNVTVKCRKF